jgi:hypothetical protein
MNEPAFRVFLGKELSINKFALRKLGCPNHIQFWLNKADKVLCVGAVPERTHESLLVRDEVYRNSYARFRYQTPRFVNMLIQNVGWEKHRIYKCAGTYLPDLNMVAFRLSESEEMEGN